MNYAESSILPNVKSVKVKVGQIPAELYGEYKKCKDAQSRVEFLEKNKYEGCLIYESLVTFQTCLNEDNVDTENCFIDFIPYEEWV